MLQRFGRGCGALALCVALGASVSTQAQQEASPATDPLKDMQAQAQEQLKRARFHMSDIKAWVAPSCASQDVNAKHACMREFQYLWRHGDDLIQEMQRASDALTANVDKVTAQQCVVASAACSDEALQIHARMKRFTKAVAMDYRIIQGYWNLVSRTRDRLGQGEYGGTFKQAADVAKNIRLHLNKAKLDHRTRVNMLLDELEVLGISRDQDRVFNSDRF